ncbi:MAG TPA: penicillin-binding protein 2 [Patescibacteria group bacterium]|nr:penicillin-binding protein 2 [Patescibacteria group bacterium]
MRWRYLVTLAFFGLTFFAISAKLFYWQVIRAADLSAMGRAQYGNQITITPQRGEIVAADNFPLATNRLSYLVYANPHEIKDIDSTASELSPLLTMDVASISAILHANTDKYWVAITSGVHYDKKQDIENMNIPGIGFEESYTRFYPEASMAAQLLGFVGQDDLGNPKGYSGLEGFYDRQLKGRFGTAVEVKDAMGRPVLSKINDDSGAQDGRSLTLTIDRPIQFLVEQKLKDGIEKFGAASGLVAVMDPKTGNILAMASFPSYDPRDYAKYDDSLYKNPFISNTYEPGSTMKPLIMATAFNENLLTPDSTCPICSEPVKVDDYDIHTWNNEYFPNISMKDVIRHSDNTGMVYVSKVLGEDRLITALNKFGIGSMTGIDLQGEAAVPLRNSWLPIDVATASFGQGISVTPIELLDAFSSLANDGKRMKPHVVSKITTPDGQTISIQPEVLDQPLSPQSAKVMTEILVYTVDKGEASFARLKGYRIAGKTGTASIPVSGHYDPTQTIASFIGYAPADDPKFAMLVIINKPTSSIYGAETAAPVFFDISRDLLTYYGIAPTGDQ